MSTVSAAINTTAAHWPDLPSTQDRAIRTFSLNFGPQHPSAHGVLRLILTLKGETIVDADAHVGLLHRGTEKLLESKTFRQGLPYRDRLDYVSRMANEHCFALSVEKLAGIVVPVRARFIRVLRLEITRILNHLMSLTTHAMDVGALTPFLWAFEERENLREIYERVSGARRHANYVRFGGVSQDIPLGTLRSLNEFIKRFADRITELQDLLTSNRIWTTRLQGVGSINRQKAFAWGFSGVRVRGSGARWDLRKTFPYETYDRRRDWTVPVGRQGDSYDRYRVRIAERRNSLKLIKRCLRLIPAGEIKATNVKLNPSKNVRRSSMESTIQHFKSRTSGFLVPTGDTYTGIEAPKGEFGVYIASLGRAQPDRVKLRAPGFYHLQGIKCRSYQHLLADVVTIIGTMDIVFGEVDR